jgi:hypothetical protein
MNQRFEGRGALARRLRGVAREPFQIAPGDEVLAGRIENERTDVLRRLDGQQELQHLVHGLRTHGIARLWPVDGEACNATLHLRQDVTHAGLRSSR